MLTLDRQIGDIIEGNGCGVSLNRTIPFKILLIKSADKFHLTVLRLVDKTQHDLGIYPDQSNWRLIKRNHRTICTECNPLI